MQLPASRFAILVAVVIGSAPLTLDAQLIRINNNGFGGVNIRVPFVRVNTSPYGTHVRAPFVEVNSPPPAYYQPPYYAPAAPFYQPAPGRPYYRVPTNPRVNGGTPNVAETGPRFTPTRPGEQSQRLGPAPSTSPRNGTRVMPKSPAGSPSMVDQVVTPPIPQPKDGKTTAPLTEKNKAPKQGKLNSVLEKKNKPPLEQIEELPPPKATKNNDAVKR